MTYDQAITATDVTLVEFFATWCPHCRKMMSVVDDVTELLGSQVAVTRLDIDENSKAADAAGVESVPTFIIYKDGREQWRQSGEIAGNSLYTKILSYI